MDQIKWSIAMNEDKFKQYQRSTMGEMRPYEPGEDLSKITVNDDDKQRYGCPKEGDMVARSPQDRDNQWLVAKEYFEANFKLV